MGLIGRRDHRPAKGRTRRHWFGRGFRQRSPLVLLAAAALVAGSLFLGQSLLFKGGLTAVDEGRLLRITHDDYVHVAYRLEQLHEHPPKVETVYLFGGSGTMECFVSEASLAARIASDTGQKIQVVSLAAHQQSMAMSLALIDNLPKDRPAVIAIGLAPMRLYASPEQDSRLLSGKPIMLRSPRLASLARKYYGRSAPKTGAITGIFDYLGSYVRERGNGNVSWGKRITYATHYYPVGTTGHLPLGKRRNVLYVLDEDKKLYQKYADYNFAVLEEVLRLCRERGYSVAFYDQPLNASAAGPDWNGVVPAYRARVRRLARAYGVAYLHIERSVHLRDDDFADLFHLLQPGREKWQPEMAEELARLIKGRAGVQVAVGAGLRAKLKTLE